MPEPSPDPVAAVRRFNRFYTRQIGVLRKDYLDSPYSLGEMRILYEIAHHDGLTARDIARSLDLDAGYLSRVLRTFEKQGLMARKTSKDDARQSHLGLTAKGRKTFAPLETRSQQQTAAMLAHLTPAEQQSLVAAMAEIERLTGRDAASTHETPAFTLRAPASGDYGWIVSQHGKLYADEYGWDASFEGLCAGIVADFVKNYDAARERCWIAKLNGEPVGTVMLVKDAAPDTARIRLLLVDPKGRGLGIGKALVAACLRFARDAGYRKVTLWTHRELTAARAIYEKKGFTLTSSEARHSFGKDVVAEFWDMVL